MTMHFICFVLGLVTQWIQINFKQSYMHNFITIGMVPYYQITIMQAFYSVSRVENVAAEAKCSGMYFARTRAWCYIEVIGFFVNLVQLMIFLLGNYTGCRNIFSCLDEQNEEESAESKEDDKLKKANELKKNGNIHRIMDFTHNALNIVMERFKPPGDPQNLIEIRSKKGDPQSALEMGDSSDDDVDDIVLIVHPRNEESYIKTQEAITKLTNSVKEDEAEYWGSEEKAPSWRD
jgi:hypothetical protein